MNSECAGYDPLALPRLHFIQIEWYDLKVRGRWLGERGEISLCNNYISVYVVFLDYGNKW